LGKRVMGAVVWWAWMPLSAYLFWLILHWVFGGLGTWSQWWRLSVVQREWLPGGTLGHATGLFWIWVAIGLIGTAVIFGDDLYEIGRLGRGKVVVVVVAVLLAGIVIVVPATEAFWDNDKDLGRYYDKATVFHITSAANPPSSLTYLTEGDRPSTGRCAYVGAADVPSCIGVGPLTGIGAWTGRTSSLDSARTMLDHAASPAPNVNVQDTSITYLYGVNGGEWTAILDGSGAATPTYGIAAWDGTTNRIQVECRFNTTDDRFDRALHGDRGNSLKDLIAEKYPNLLWRDDDVWGYCQGNRPVIVIRAEKQVGYKSRSVLTAAGVLTVTGSAHGVAFDYRRHVSPGEFPGAVYPSGLVDAQVSNVSWAAGRKWKERANFGFAPTSASVQEGNVRDYLLQGPGKRLYYVTPLTPNRSTSQAFVGYAVSPADQVDNGRLNELDVWVLPDGDPQIANLNTLTNTAANSLRAVDSTFLNTGGSLEEFTPLGGDMWRVYGVRDGLVQYYVDVSASGRVQPATYTATGTVPSGRPPAEPRPTTDCGEPPAKLTVQQLTACLASLAGALQQREAGH
jgi:hypothetical protein